MRVTLYSVVMVHLEGIQACRDMVLLSEIIRDIVAESGGLGVTTNFIAEIMSTIRALEWAVEHQKLKVIMNYDSSATVTAFTNQKLL